MPSDDNCCRRRRSNGAPLGSAMVAVRHLSRASDDGKKIVRSSTVNALSRYT